MLVGAVAALAALSVAACSSDQSTPISVVAATGTEANDPVFGSVSPGGELTVADVSYTAVFGPDENCTVAGDVRLKSGMWSAPPDGGFVKAPGTRRTCTFAPGSAKSVKIANGDKFTIYLGVAPIKATRLAKGSRVIRVTCRRANARADWSCSHDLVVVQ